MTDREGERLQYFDYYSPPDGKAHQKQVLPASEESQWTLELSLPQINLFKVVLKSLKQAKISDLRVKTEPYNV